MVKIKQQLDTDDHYKGQNKIEYIVIHDTGNSTDSDEANANYFTTGTRNASAHYFIDDDSITQVVKDCDGAYHVGDGKNKYGINNRNSLGIEMCRTNNKVSPKTLQNTIELVKLLMSKYSLSNDKVVRHYDASRKNCPESMSDNNWSKWFEFKKQLINNANVNKPIISNIDGKTGICMGDGVRIRSTKDTSTKNNILGQLNKGDKVKLYRKEGNWYHIYYPQHGGFVSADYIKEM